MRVPVALAVLIAGALLLVTLPAAAQDTDPAVAEALAAIEQQYQQVRQTGFAAGPAMSAFERDVRAFLDANEDQLDPATRATARAYLVRCLLTNEDYEAVFAACDELLAVDRLTDNDRMKLLYYRGFAAMRTGDEALARRSCEQLIPLHQQIGMALLQQINAEFPAVVVGEPAPDWTLQTVTGDSEVTLSDLEGKYVLLDFWATWCGPCRNVMAQVLKPLHDQVGHDPRFELVGVGTNWRDDTAQAQAQFAEENDYHWTKVYDATGYVTATYGVRGIPTLTLIGPDGNVIAHGGAGEVLPILQETLHRALAEPAGPQGPDSTDPDGPDNGGTDREEDF